MAIIFGFISVCLLFCFILGVKNQMTSFSQSMAGYPVGSSNSVFSRVKLLFPFINERFRNKMFSKHYAAMESRQVEG